MRMACRMKPKEPAEDLPAFNRENWKKDAREFGKLYLSRYLADKVTTYLHIFVYHVGEFIDMHGSIEAYGNYVIEGLHRRLKTAPNCFKDAADQCRRWLTSAQCVSLNQSEQVKETEHTQAQERLRKKKRKQEWPEISIEARLKKRHEAEERSKGKEPCEE